MPKGPKGQKRPADSIGCAVMVARIATGEEEDTAYAMPSRAKSGKAGAQARSKTLTAEERVEIARNAANKRWDAKEATMLDHANACDSVAALYKEKEAAGLVDVKFLFQNKEEVTVEEACGELLAFHEAVAEGRVRDLDFGDLAWKD